MTFTHHRRKNSSRMNARTRQSSAIGYRTPPVSVSSQSLSPDCLCGQTMYPRKFNPCWLRRSSVVSRAICRSPLPCGNINARRDLLRARLSAIQSMRARFNVLLANQTDRPKLRSKLFGRFTLVRVVLHGLRRSPVANRRLGGEAARSGGICHLLGEYTVARPSRSQS
jgi:hypothetical protein